MTEAEGMILTELRETRKTISDLSARIGERLAVLETKVSDLETITGSDGRLSKLETSLESLNQLRWVLTGAGMVIGCVSGWILRWIVKGA